MRSFGASVIRRFSAAGRRRYRRAFPPQRDRSWRNAGMRAGAVACAMFFCVATFAGGRSGASGRLRLPAGESVRAAADACPLRAVCAKRARMQAAGIALCDG